ncbi:hypothetical protein [Chryseobacterium daeguense]|uniref:hypothetical protein n=1 Tax=Chryseobacterium daeguense TaxID=412438 RepID=UPI000683D703|nr:hypothetical protein [Chryseobacterium daeguense]
MMRKLFLLVLIMLSTFFLAQAQNLVVADYHSGCAPITNGIKIKTNIPFDNGGMPTVFIEGYAYGQEKTMNLAISWYVFQGQVYQSSNVSSFGAHTPKVTIAKETYNGGDFAVIYLNDTTYCLNFRVRLGNSTINGVPVTWPVVDEPLYATVKKELPYKNAFSGTIDFDQNSIASFYGNRTYFKNKVGINSLNPDAELTVKGKIHAEEVKVDLNVPADYVFEKYYTGKSDLKSDYIMPTLKEVEAFTKANNHLPNVPSAKEIKENGLQVGEMINILLQKVEELTLYSLEQQKKIEELQQEVKNLKK